MKLYRILLLSLFAYALISCGGAEERKAVYMEKAKSSIETGDLDKARIELKNVLQIDPKDGEAHYLLGKVHEQNKNYRKAFASYKKAEDLNPNLLENKARLGRLYLLLANELDEAQQRIDFILSKDPINAEGLLLKAAALLRSDKKAEAVSIAEDVLSREPGNIDAVTFVVTTYVKDSNSEKALAVLETALQSRPDNDHLNNLLALIHLSNKDYERAATIYKMLLEKYPDKSSSYNKLATLYNAAGNIDKAEETLRASIESAPEDVERHLVLVKYIAKNKGNDEAIQELKSAVSNNNSIGRLRIALGELLLLTGDEPSAIDVYADAINDFPEEITSVEASIALTSVYYNKKEFAKARVILDSAMSVSPNDPKLNYLRAKLALHDKDNEKAIISLRVVTTETPDNIEAYLLLVNVYKQEGNAEQVRNTLNLAYNNNKSNPEALLKLSKYYLQTDLAQTEKIIDDYNELKKLDYEGMSIKTVILNQTDSEAEAYELAKKLMELFPEKPNGYLQSIPYLVKTNNIEQAASVLEKGYLTTKDNRKILILLTRLQTSEKKFDIVENRLKAELKAKPEDAELKLLLAKLYLSNKKNSKAETILLDVIDSKPGAEDPYLVLSQLYRSDNDIASLKAILIKGKNNVTASYKLPLKLASLYEVNEEYLQAINVYRDLYKKYPANLVVINNLASMLSDYSEDKDDLELAKTLAKKLEDSKKPVFLDTIGWVYYKLGDYQSAIMHLSKVVETMPDVNIFNYHLGMSYKMAGEKNKAKTYLEKSLANNKQFKQKDKAEAALRQL